MTLRLERLESRTLLNAAALDPDFGTDGKVVFDLSGDDLIADVALGNGGQLVAVGSRLGDASADFAVARFNADGSLDTSFGIGGTVVLDLGANDRASGIALQADGRIVVAGSAGLDFVVVRLNAGGGLDTSFDGDGMAVIDFAGGEDAAAAVALQSDGRIVVAGSTFTSTGTDFAVARLNADGSLDAGFDGDGRVTIDFAGAEDFAAALVVQGDGRIVVMGESGGDFALAGLTAGGVPDAGFGTDGQVTIDFGSASDTAAAGVLQDNGQIVVAGSTGQDFAAARLNGDGSLDSSFGADGRVTADFAAGNDTAADLQLQTDGSIVVVGSTGTDFGLARLDADGSLDTTFGTGGLFTLDFAGGNDFATAAALRPDGSVVVAGSASNGSNQDFALTQLTTIAANPIQLFIEQLYQEILGRSADPGGLAFWSALMDAGISRASLVLALQATEEAQRLLVIDLYNRFLQRAADPGGLSAAVAFLQAGGTVDQLKAELLGSAEYFQTRGGGTNDGFLEAVYQDVLGRAADPLGQAGWGALMADGASAASVALAILQSREADAALVQALTLELLGRPADTAGLDFWTGVLQRGVPDEQVFAAIASSAEFFAQV